jgi:hypothetical protein
MPRGKRHPIQVPASSISTNATTSNPDENHSSESESDIEVTANPTPQESQSTSDATTTPCDGSVKNKKPQKTRNQESSTSTETEPTNKKRKTTSDVWSHFEQYGTGALIFVFSFIPLFFITNWILKSHYITAGDQLKAVCCSCQARLTGRSAGGTTHLWRHLKRCSNFQSKQKQALLKTSAGTTTNWSFSQDESRNLLAKMVIAHEQPFTLVDNPLFRKFLASLQPKFRLFSSTTLKSDVMQLYDSMKVELAREISQVDCIALTTDLWTSKNQTPFMVVSAHFILPNWILKKRLIAFKELPTPHTGIAIGKQLINTMGD